jgi:hypothetical protein
MSSMLLCGLRFVPPVSKQMPLPTRASGASLAPRGRDREKRAGAQARELSFAVELVAQAELTREFLQQPAITGRIEHVRRQGGQPARQIVAGGGRHRAIEIGARELGGEQNLAQATARLRFALETRERKSRCLDRRHEGQ